jgi:hypothetical protein
MGGKVNFYENKILIEAVSNKFPREIGRRNFHPRSNN